VNAGGDGGFEDDVGGGIGCFDVSEYPRSAPIDDFN